MVVQVRAAGRLAPEPARAACGIPVEKETRERARNRSRLEAEKELISILAEEKVIRAREIWVALAPVEHRALLAAGNSISIRAKGTEEKVLAEQTQI